MKLLLSIFLMVSLIGCSGFYYHPEKKHYATPENYKKKYIDLPLKTKSGIKLHVWKIFGNNAKNLVVQFHGNAQNISTHMGSLIWLTDHQYDLITFDYRGYGHSEGTPSPLGLREDSIAFLKLIHDEFKKGPYEKLIIIGQSLGGAVLMDGLIHYPHPTSIDLLVLDSTFASYKRLGMRVLSAHWLTFLFSPLSYLVADNETAPIHNLKKLTIPKLLIHSENDPIVSFNEGMDLYEELPEPKELWSFKVPSHIGSFFIEKGAYRQKFLNYVNGLKKN